MPLPPVPTLLERLFPASFAASKLHARFGLTHARLGRAILATAVVAIAEPALAQEGSPAGPVPVEFLEARRTALLDRMGNGVLVLRSASPRSIEGDYPQDSDYRESNDFFYLTGLEAPGSWLILIARATGPDSVRLYLPPPKPEEERWTGPRPGPGRRPFPLPGSATSGQPKKPSPKSRASSRLMRRRSPGALSSRRSQKMKHRRAAACRVRVSRRSPPSM